MAERGSIAPRLLALIAGIAALLALATPRADAALYWTNDAGDPGHPGTVGRAATDGTGANNAFITSPNGACGVAADARYLYWAVGGGPQGYVARANLSTGAIESTFIATANNLNCGVAVNGASVFFNNYAMGAIARANLDGTGINQTFVTGGSNPQQPAVGATHVYWVNKNAQTVGRAELGGGNVEQALIPTKCAEPVGVAVDATYVYWANTGCESIGRAKLDGTEVDQDFVDLDEEGPCGLAVDSGHIYWGRYGEESGAYVGRANIDGGEVNEKFIATAGYTCGVAVGPDPVTTPVPISAPAAPVKTPGFALKPPFRCTKDCKRVLVDVQFDAAGQVVVEQALPPKRGKGTSKASASAKRTPKLIKRLTTAVKSGTVTLRLKTTGAGKAAAKAKGKLKVKARFTFTPSSGSSSSLTRVIKAKPPKPKR